MSPVIRLGTLVQTLGRRKTIRTPVPAGPLYTNWVPDPRMTSLTNKDASNGTLSLVTNYPVYGTALRATRTSTSAGRIGIAFNGVGFVWSASKTYTAVLTVNASALITGATFIARTNTAGAAGQVIWRTGNIPAGESSYTVSGAGPASGNAFVVVSAGAVAATLDLVRLAVYDTTAPSGHRDGSSPGWVWNGTTDASTSSGRN